MGPELTNGCRSEDFDNSSVENANFSVNFSSLLDESSNSRIASLSGAGRTKSLSEKVD